MPISQERLAHLLEVYSNGTASNDEVNELFTWAQENDDPGPVKEHIRQLITSYDPTGLDPAVDWDDLFQRIQRRNVDAGDMDAGGGGAAAPQHSLGETAERLPIRRISWFRAVAAAVIVLVGGTFLLYQLGPGNPPPVATTPPAKQLQPDIQPGADGAILTLANGQQIVLDSAGTGALATQGKTRLLNQHGQLSYHNDPQQQEQSILYNTITTTRGRQYQLRLADGSKVWLNAASSIKFPTAFTGDSRQVEVSGEVYFEVAADASRPFTVRIHDGEEILVLGTHFNVNAYDDEGLIRTTLLEGSVRIKHQTQSRVLKPGEQAQVVNRGSGSSTGGGVGGSGSSTNGGAGVGGDPGARGDAIKVIDNADIDEITAWKDGLFLMKKADVASILRQITRWYDVEIVYKGEVPSGRISGDIPRNMALSKVLEVMELSGVHCTVDGKKLIVSPR